MQIIRPRIACQCFHRVTRKESGPPASVGLIMVTSVRRPGQLVSRPSRPLPVNHIVCTPVHLQPASTELQSSQKVSLGSKGANNLFSIEGNKDRVAFCSLLLKKSYLSLPGHQLTFIEPCIYLLTAQLSLVASVCPFVCALTIDLRPSWGSTLTLVRLAM